MTFLVLTGRMPRFPGGVRWLGPAVPSRVRQWSSRLCSQAGHGG